MVLKVFLILLLYLVSSMESCEKQVAKYYCTQLDVCPKQTSIACKYTKKPGMKCEGNLTKIDKNEILHWHNMRRNIIALGKVPGYKAARRMGTMKWNNQLEQMAKYNVATCKVAHDKCRNTVRFKKSGQNIYSESTSGQLSPVMTIAYNGVKAWFKEKKYANMKIIEKYRDTSMAIGHFTAMIKYNSDYVGCAASKFKKQGKSRVIFTCNYASTNVLGSFVYEAGRSGSYCKTGRHSIYRGLCSSNENFGNGKNLKYNFRR